MKFIPHNLKFSGFERQLSGLHPTTLGATRDYLRCQQRLIDAHDIDECVLHGSNVPYLAITYINDSKIIHAKTIIAYDTFIGCIWRPVLSSEERFSLKSIDELAKLLKKELVAPSLNFCTIIGNY